MAKLNAATRLLAAKPKRNAIVPSFDSNTPVMRARSEGAQAALARQPSSTNPYRGKNKPRLWQAWGLGYRDTCLKHGIYIDGED